MKWLLLILLILCAASAAALPSDTVWFGRAYYQAPITTSTSADVWGDADTLYQFTPVAGYTYVLKRVYMRVKNYTNDTSSLSVGLYTVDTATDYPDDSVWSVCRQMSAEEQTGSDQTIYTDCEVTLTVGVTYCWTSGMNTNGMRRVVSDSGYYIGGSGDTTGISDSALASALGTVSQQLTPTTLAATWTHYAVLNKHPVIWGLVERTASEAPADAGARVIIISE